MKTKLKKLKNHLKSLRKVAVAFSSGVDSTFLLKVAKDTLKENIIAITINAINFPEREIIEAKEFCTKNNIKHILIDFNPLKIKECKKNSKERCYICKKEMFQNIIQTANINGFENIIEGSNLDDLDDFRPGLKALKELNIISPLKDAGLTKSEIRKLSYDLNLYTYNKASFACLLTRFRWREHITKEKLKMVETSEHILYKKGFSQFRVRYEGKCARIEVFENEFDKLLKYRNDITESFLKLGFNNVSMDLRGYKKGSMN